MGLTDTSKFLSLILRHKPETIEIKLDEHGWAAGMESLYRVAAGKMADDGYEFFLSVNGVWLTKAVPAEYLSKI